MCLRLEASKVESPAEDSADLAFSARLRLNRAPASRGRGGKRPHTMVESPDCRAVMADKQSNSMNGRVLAQRYRLVDKLGEGGMGSVWRAEHLELGTLVAVKLISEEVAKNPEALARFRREAHAAAALRSPHVVQILDYGVDGDTPFMVMELLDGESLADRLARRGSLDLQETSRILSQVARAVGKAHSFGIVHRDLKPDNIFIVDNEDEEVAKVLDFGIAKATRDVTGSVGMMTGTGVMLGTPYYMSPEQAAGKREVDHRTDTWALAVIAYQCLVGRPPFRADTIGGLVLAICTEEAPRPSRNAKLDPAFDAWFLHGVQRDPDRRFQAARELADSLRALAEGLGQAAQPAHQGTGATARGSFPGAVVPQAASVRSSVVSTTAQNTSMTQSVLDPPATTRSPLLVAGLILVPILALGGYAAYRGLGSGDASSAAASASPTQASEPVAMTAARPSEAAPDPAPPAKTESPKLAPNPEPAPPAEFVDLAPVPAERPAEPAKPRRKSSAAKATAPAKPAPEPAPAAPAPSPSETSKPSAPSQRPSAPSAKPVERSKIDLAF